MKQFVSIACAAALVCGCAAPRPATGPGSGQGATYVPLVEPTTVAADVYDEDVARCQHMASSIPFMAHEHDEALFWLAAGTVIPAFASNMNMYSVFAGGWTSGGNYWFRDWVYTPQREAWHAKQETSLMNCMARKGYVNTDPSVRVTWVPRSRSVDPTLRPTGRDTYNAEQLAKRQQCNATPMATLVDKGPGFESYTVPCVGGQVIAIRCEFGHCRSAAGG